jgi:hypothetical protein
MKQRVESGKPCSSSKKSVLESAGLVDLCTDAGVCQCPTPAIEYTVCDRAASILKSNSSDISSVRKLTELEVDGCEGIAMSKFRNSELVPSCFIVTSDEGEDEGDHFEYYILKYLF